MTPASLQLDFVGEGRRASLVGTLVLVVGIVGAVWTVVEYRDLSIQEDLAQAQLAEHGPRKAKGVRMPAITDKRNLDDAAAAVAELSLPWSQLLDELEAAGQDSSRDIAVLSIQPDPEKHRVRIGAEARTLPAALAFAQRLQMARTLAHPLLDNHKVRTDQRERPVYFELTAEWKS